MVDVVTWENSHRFGSALVTQHRLRHRVFIERQGWNIPGAGCQLYLVVRVQDLVALRSVHR